MDVLHATTFESYHPKRVSYIVRTKNRAAYLEEALARARALVTPEDELIVIDGGADDATREVVARYADLVDIFVSEPDLSGAHAFGKGILLARGRFIRELADDDITHHEGMMQAIRAMEGHPEIDLLLCGGTKERNGVVWEMYVPPGVNYGKRPEDVFSYPGASGVGHVIRRSAVARMGLLYPSDTINADAAYVAAAIKSGATVKFCRINLFHHPIYEHSAIIKNKRAHLRDTYRLIYMYCPWRFYLRYRIKRILGDYGLMRRSSKSVQGSSRNRIVWDGGFS